VAALALEQSGGREPVSGRLATPFYCWAISRRNPSPSHTLHFAKASFPRKRMARRATPITRSPVPAQAVQAGGGWSMKVALSIISPGIGNVAHNNESLTIRLGAIAGGSRPSFPSTRI
jgi:hypothetical protein